MLNRTNIICIVDSAHTFWQLNINIFQTASKVGLIYMKASDYFHGPEKYNCAQAVLKTFQKKYNIPEEIIAEYSKFGGGRALDGFCGALYALHYIAQAEEHICSANAYFKKRAGSTKCREIKKLNKLTCKECVDLSAEIIKTLA